MPSEQLNDLILLRDEGTVSFRPRLGWRIGSWILLAVWPFAYVGTIYGLWRNPVADRIGILILAVGLLGIPIVPLFTLTSYLRIGVDQLTYRNTTRIHHVRMAAIHNCVPTSAGIRITMKDDTSALVMSVVKFNPSIWFRIRTRSDRICELILFLADTQFLEVTTPQ
jgi:hypothetical protein